MKKTLSFSLATLLLFSQGSAFSQNLGSGVTSPYDGSNYLASPGQITLASPQTPGTIVHFSDTNGLGIQNGTPLTWVHNGANDQVQYIQGQATFPDGSTGHLLQYDIQSVNHDNGYLLVAQQDVADWITAMGGNPNYVNGQLQNQFSTMTAAGSWQVAPLPNVINYSGGIIQGINNDSSRTYVVTGDGMHAVPGAQIIPTPPPTAVLAINTPKTQNQYTIGDQITFNLTSNVSAANTNYHRIALKLDGPSGTQYLPVTDQSGTSYPAATNYYFDNATSVPGGGGSNGSTLTYNETSTLDTTNLTTGSYQLGFILYDNVSRSAKEQDVTFTLSAGPTPPPPTGGGGGITPPPPPPPAGPSITLSANPTSLTTGQSATLTATAQNIPAGDSVVINDVNLNNTLAGQNQAKGATATATSYTAITGTYQAFIVSASGNYDAQSQQVQVTWQKPANTPPVAKIYVPNPVKVGDDVTLDGGGSNDPDQPLDPAKGIIAYHWQVSGPGNFSGPLSQSMSTGQFDTPGIYQITLTVYDSDGGASGTATTTIDVQPPGPTAIDTIGGTLKQNRLVTVDATQSTSPKLYPIDWSKTQWTITAVSGGSSSDIKYVNSLTGTQNNQLLFKQPGQYQISVTVVNSLGLSDTNTQIITITPDYAPIADYSFDAQTVTIDPNNSYWATFRIIDKSSSPDQDLIAKRIWKITYDANNNGIYTDDPTVSIDDSTLSFGVLQDIQIGAETFKIEKNMENGQYVFYILQKHVGKIYVDLQVVENFGQPTLPQFISPSDYKTGDTWTKTN